ncbi:hypothetical protein B1F79_01860 [Coxiella-like endosymbiont of Rhipicephalus sanguineus]|nr:hypothetical protein [Coxiella-like endosymbiont of Rhipicephalus sanguineus]
MPYNAILIILILKGNPQWFKIRLDRSLQYAENRPKNMKIFILFILILKVRNLYSKNGKKLFFWIKEGIKIF